MNKKGMLYITTIYCIQVLNILLNILLIRFLSLEQLGTITLAKIYFQFMDYTHLGMRMAIDRLSPIQNNKENFLTINIAFYITLLVSMMYLSTVYFFISKDTIVLLFMFSGLIFALGNIFKSYYRATEHFKNMFFMTILLSLVPLIGQLFFLIQYGYTAFIYGTFFIYLLVFIVYLKYFNLLSISHFHKIKEKTKFMFSIGGLLFLSSLISFMAFSIDKLLLAYFEGRTLLGEYSIVLFAFSMFLIIPNSLGELLFPKIIKDVNNGNNTKLFHYIFYLLVPTLVFIVSANCAMDYIIKSFMPEYIVLLKNLHLISWSVLVYSITPVYYHLLNAHDERINIIKANLYSLLLLVLYLFYSINLAGDIIFSFILGKYIFGISLLGFYLYYYFQIGVSK